jgi:formyl-CoA transferase
MAGWFRKHDFKEAMRMLDEGEVVAGPIYTIEDIFEDPQYEARENIVEVPILISAPCGCKARSRA